MITHRKLKDSTGRRLLISLVAGVAAGFGFSMTGLGTTSILLGWDSAVLIFIVWTWIIIWPMDSERTARYATREDPSHRVSSTILILASIAALVAVGVALVQSHHHHGLEQLLYAGIGLSSVVISWVLVHSLLTLNYAHIYYDGERGGVDFKRDHVPSYADFAYLALTVGMTFQIADTDIIGTKFRKVVLRHALLSYLFGTVILATTIKLIAGLGN